jgi:hypothetical protein
MTEPATRLNSGLWYRASLRDQGTVDERVSIIREQFAVAVEAAGSPDGACLFLAGPGTDSGTAGPDDGAAPEAALFFSPAAISVVPHLIALCGAVPSLPPDRAYVTLLVGNQADWDLLPRQIH